MSFGPGSGQVATAAVNEITGARLVSRAPTEAYKDGWDRIFGKKEEEKPPEPKVEDKK
jgi:hypothetical protein